ncbi:MAG TPA: cytochrome c biogenesis protein CcsA [Phnomibacter sp.]|nr:cytochrome c biogenesis protein CcsA [Phnomibacter sp.]
MEYLGEHLLPGQIGHFLVVLSLVSSLVASISFFLSFRSPALDARKNWLKIARIAFLLETVAVLGTFISLYYIISHHLFEYKYAWQHSSKALPMEYLLSCFWEGQEGSFMLWSFWHCVLGWVLIAKAGKWEGPTMTVVSFAQFTLATMILGVYFFGVKVGSSPFSLLRNEMEAPIFSKPNYLSLVTDGNGLNALLQNYWMVIHPPVLFLGFASTIVPFAFAIGGLLTKDDKGWATPALPWASFSAAALGLGIMMGAAWAYESLTFGGYWAWDPVENASLVPWMVLISGLHTNLILKNSGNSIRTTYLFYILSFLLVLYSTFLTRSGVLGDTSVHSFTDSGMNVQLIIFMAVFALPAFTLYFTRFKSIPSPQKEENLYSREFWMLIGSLVFFFSGLVVIGKTSLPVINKIFGSKIAPPQDVEFSHNQIQVWVAVIIGILTAVTQYFKYKGTPKKTFYSKLLWPTILTIVFGTIISLSMGISYDKRGPGFQAALYIALFMAVYAIVANAGYIWTGMKGKLRLAGASVAHVGFGLVLLGILLSAGNKKVMSYNTTGISPLKADDKENSYENTTLIKGTSTDMGNFMVTYVKDTLNHRNSKRYYEIDFKAKQGSEQFKLYPDVIENNKGGEGLTPNPDARHYLGKDIFTYLTFLSDPKAKSKDTTSFRTRMVIIGDTSFYSNGMWTVNHVELNPKDARFAQYAGDTLMAADISVISKDGKLYKARPAFRLQGNMLEMIADTVMSQSLIFAIRRPGDIKKKEVEIAVKESSAILDFVTLKVYEFPMINMLWLGILVTVAGFIISMVQRIQLIRRKQVE